MNEDNNIIGAVIGGVATVGRLTIGAKRLKIRIVTKRREENLLDDFDEHPPRYFSESGLTLVQNHRIPHCE